MKVSYCEGFSYCTGDALFGMNPVDDTLGAVERTMNSYQDFVERWEIPTQSCCLCHVTTAMECIKNGAREALCFQSIAGMPSLTKAIAAGFESKLVSTPVAVCGKLCPSTHSACASSA